MAWMRAEKQEKNRLAIAPYDIHQFGVKIYIRVADGFLPKYLAWYRPMRPLALTSGALPLGSFS